MAPAILALTGTFAQTVSTGPVAGAERIVRNPTSGAPAAGARCTGGSGTAALNAARGGEVGGRPIFGITISHCSSATFAVAPAALVIAAVGLNTAGGGLNAGGSHCGCCASETLGAAARGADRYDHVTAN